MDNRGSERLRALRRSYGQRALGRSVWSPLTLHTFSLKKWLSVLLTLTPNKKHLLHVDWTHVLACSGVIETRASGSTANPCCVLCTGIFSGLFHFQKSFSSLDLQAHFRSLTALGKIMLWCGPLHCGLGGRGPLVLCSQINLPWNRTALVEKING